MSALLGRVRALLLVGLVGGAASVACSSFGADDPGASTNDGGPGSDSPSSGGDATPADGPAADGGDAAVAGTATFTEHFDVAGWEKSWDTGNQAPLVADTGGAQSLPSSLHVQLAAAATHHEIVKGYLAPKKLRVKASIFLGKQGNGDVDFISLSDNTDPKVETSVSFSATSGSFVGELFDTPANATVNTLAIGIVSGTWIDVELEVDLVARTWSMWRGSTLLGSQPLNATWTPNTLFVKVGAPFATNITQPWDLRIDDVVVTVTGP